ncbi:hypothetical protein OSTOST_19864 [Ostertagia ostertagi]
MRLLSFRFSLKAIILSKQLDRSETAGFQQFAIDELKRSVCDHTSVLATTCDRFVEGVVPRLVSKFAHISKSGDFCAKVRFILRSIPTVRGEVKIRQLDQAHNEYYLIIPVMAFEQD